MNAYAFIRTHTDQYAVAKMAKVLHVSESGYYKWLSRPLSRRDEENLFLIEQIAAIFYASHL